MPGHDAGLTVSAMEIVSYDTYSQLAPLEETWERLSERECQFIPSFAELLHQLNGGKTKFRLLAAIENAQITAIACFIYRNAKKEYELATRRLFRLAVKEVSLFGSCVLGQPNEALIREFFQIIIKEPDYDIINLHDIFIKSPLYKVVTNVRGVIAAKAARKARYWWLIRLPRSFDEYIASLPANTRGHLARDCRKCEREGPVFRVMCSPDDVDDFLQDAERVSRSTYQWKLGYGVHNDTRTRELFIRTAKAGSLRSYMLYLDDTPVAFGWGRLSHRTFVFERTGYDPQYRKLSPGTTLIMRMARDLIENTNCEYFDFKWGGDDGYKSRLGNVKISCIPIELAPVYRPYSILVVGLDQVLSVSKKLVASVVDRPAIKQRLRTALRRYGVGTY